MKVYDYYKETNKKINYKQIIIGIIVVTILLLAVLASTFYTEIVQLNEIGNYSSIFIRNVIYQSIFFIISFIIIFALLFVTNKQIIILFRLLDSPFLPQSKGKVKRKKVKVSG